MGRAAATVLLESVPELVRTSLLFKSINAAALRAHVLSVRRVLAMLLELYPQLWID